LVNPLRAGLRRRPTLHLFLRLFPQYGEFPLLFTESLMKLLDLLVPIAQPLDAERRRLSGSSGQHPPNDETSAKGRQGNPHRLETDRGQRSPPDFTVSLMSRC
jgi:hypothetical protein